MCYSRCFRCKHYDGKELKHFNLLNIKFHTWEYYCLLDGIRFPEKCKYSFDIEKAEEQRMYILIMLFVVLFFWVASFSLIIFLVLSK